MSKGYLALVLASVDNGIGDFVFWAILIIAIPAVFLIGILYLVGRMSSSINNKPGMDEREQPDEGAHGDGNENDYV